MDELAITDERLSVAVRAAREAGGLAESMQETAGVTVKDNETVVTEADEAAEETVRNRLNSESSLPILGEEQGGDMSADEYWVVDPIDGTNNFAAGQPFYGTAIGLVSNGEVVVGVFYMPRLEYLFYAVDGKGAYLNHERLSVAEPVPVEDGKFMISGWKCDELHAGVRTMNRWVQRFGCAVMATAWIAAGWSNCALLAGLAPWDTVVGVVLVREAGGVVETVDTGKTSWESIRDGGIVLGHEEMVERVRVALPDETVRGFVEATYPE